MQPLVSVVVPLYNEEQVIDRMYERLTASLQSLGLPYEIVMVNDGSRDHTLSLARAISMKDARAKVVSFSRNFGHQIAITAGMDKSAGDVVVIIDADLQDPPEVIGDMIDKWREGYEVVYGVRKKREGETVFKRVTASLFYRFLRRMTSVDIPIDTGDFRLMDKKVVDQLRRMHERNRFVRGMVSWVGFRQTHVEYVREKRAAGETKYPLHKMIRFAIDGILSFSYLPLRLSSALGFVSSGVSFLFIVYGVIARLFFSHRVVTGWASTFVAVLFLGGVQLISVGLLGEYLGRVHDEIKGRPLYIVDEQINLE